VSNGDTPTPLLMIAGQVCPPHLAARVIAGCWTATMDQNGSGYRLFAPPLPAGAIVEPARISIRRVPPTGDMTADSSDALPGSLGTVA
jgi:hypothetical protein